MKRRFVVFAVLLLTVTGCIDTTLTGGTPVKDEVIIASEGLYHLVIDTVSADVDARVGNTQDIIVELNGDIRINRGYQDALLKLAVDRKDNVVTVSPQFVEGMEVNSYSGSLRILVTLPQNQVPRLSVRTVSGNSKVADYSGDLQLNSSSGTITIAINRALTNNIDARTVSGRIIASLPSKGNYSLTGSTVSGRLNLGGMAERTRNSFAGQVGPYASSIRVNLTTVSGSVFISPN